jgi:hypothetical protein
MRPRAIGAIRPTTAGNGTPFVVGAYKKITDEITGTSALKESGAYD